MEVTMMYRSEVISVQWLIVLLNSNHLLNCRSLGEVLTIVSMCSNHRILSSLCKFNLQPRRFWWCWCGVAQASSHSPWWQETPYQYSPLFSLSQCQQWTASQRHQSSLRQSWAGCTAGGGHHDACDTTKEEGVGVQWGVVNLELQMYHLVDLYIGYRLLNTVAASTCTVKLKMWMLYGQVPREVPSFQYVFHWDYFKESTF